MQKVIVAGGAGFIGSQLCKSLLKKSYQVICIDNLITGSRANIKDCENNSNFIFIEFDIARDFSHIKDQITGVQYIFHLASPASPNKKSQRSYFNKPIETMLVNSQGTYNLLSFAKETSAHFLYASSSEIYGDPQVSPQTEDYFGNVNSIGVRSVYDESKRFGEAITFAFIRAHNINARVIRIFNTYGPFMQIDDGRVVSNFITQALQNKPITIYGDGKQTRSFCYISDMIDGLQDAMFSENTKGQVMNMGNPDERSVLQLATIVKEMTKSNSQILYEELPEDDPKVRKPDIQKVSKLLQWTPKVKLEEGLQKTIDYFKQVI